MFREGGFSHVFMSVFPRLGGRVKETEKEIFFGSFLVSEVFRQQVCTFLFSHLCVDV